MTFLSVLLTKTDVLWGLFTNFRILKDLGFHLQQHKNFPPGWCYRHPIWGRIKFKMKVMRTWFILLAPWGSLLPAFGPLSTQAELFGALGGVSDQSSCHFRQFQTVCFLSPKKQNGGGLGVVPQFFFFNLNLIFLVSWNPTQNFRTLCFDGNAFGKRTNFARTKNTTPRIKGNGNLTLTPRIKGNGNRCWKWLWEYYKELKTNLVPLLIMTPGPLKGRSAKPAVPEYSK